MQFCPSFVPQALKGCNFCPFLVPRALRGTKMPIIEVKSDESGKTLTNTTLTSILMGLIKSQKKMINNNKY